MAYKEVSRVEITEVIRQWQARRGIREKRGQPVWPATRFENTF